EGHAEIREGAISHRALGEIHPHLLVADLLRALDLHDHALIFHGGSSNSTNPTPAIPIAGGSNWMALTVTPANGATPNRASRGEGASPYAFSNGVTQATTGQ